MLPQLVYIAITCLGLGIAMCNHGEETKQNFWSCLLATCIQIGIMHWGGFFDVLIR